MVMKKLIALLVLGVLSSQMYAKVGENAGKECKNIPQVNRDVANAKNKGSEATKDAKANLKEEKQKKTKNVSESDAQR